MQKSAQELLGWQRGIFNRFPGDENQTSEPGVEEVLENDRQSDVGLA
jgi:hypothetical protein